MGRQTAFLNKEQIKTRDESFSESRIYMAEVMDTRSPTRSGEILVWVLNSNTPRENPEGWIMAKSCVSNFGLSINDSEVFSNSYLLQTTSYGQWNPIPYVGSYVFIFYPNIQGGNSSPYWFGCPMQPNNMMLPGISYNLMDKSNQKDYTATCELNYKSQESSPQPYVPLQNGLIIQGLDQDRLRGISTASSYRDSPSHCYGYLSPLGNQFVIDDGWSTGDSNVSWINDPRVNDRDNNNKDDYGDYFSKQEWVASLKEEDKENKLNRFHGGFRFRTRNGTQLLILDAGNIYAINKDGTAWMEMSEDGHIDCYSKNGIACASDGDINLHGRNVNIEATGMINMRAGDGFSIDTEANINIQSGTVNVSDNISVDTIQANNGYVGNFQSPIAQINGTFSGTLQGTAFFATSAGIQPIEQPLPEIDNSVVDTVSITGLAKVKAKVGEGEIDKLVSRLPTAEPWAEHDRNDRIPDLIVKQTIKKEEKNDVQPEVISNIVRT